MLEGPVYSLLLYIVKSELTQLRTCTNLKLEGLEGWLACRGADEDQVRFTINANLKTIGTMGGERQALADHSLYNSQAA
jgi:hypothetical protein